MGNLRGFSSYEEEIWDRHESTINSLASYNQIVAWLAGDGKGNQVRTQSVAIREMAKNLAAKYELLEEARDETNVQRLRDLKREAGDIIVPEQREETQSTIQTYIDEYERVEAERVEAEREEEREEQRQLEDDLAFQRQSARARYQEARSDRERAIAEQELRSIEGGAQSLGQLKGVQTRRSRSAFRSIVE